MPMLGLLAAGLLSGCGSDQNAVALANARTLKTSTLALMAKANEPYTAHAAEVTTQNAKLDDAYAFEQGRPGNKATVGIWTSLLRNSPNMPGSGVYPRFLAQWQTKGTLQPAYIADKQENVTESFDQIIRLESAKPVR